MIQRQFGCGSDGYAGHSSDAPLHIYLRERSKLVHSFGLTLRGLWARLTSRTTKPLETASDKPGVLVLIFSLQSKPCVGAVALSLSPQPKSSTQVVVLKLVGVVITEQAATAFGQQSGVAGTVSYSGEST